jgi:hypothetical protein
MANASINLGNGNWSVKESKLLGSRPIKDKIAPIEFDVNRASTATRVNKQGLIETVNSNIARIDYSNDAKGALLLEPQSTNLITYSEDFSEWSLGSGVTIESGYDAPDGTNSAYKILGSGGGALIFSGIASQTQTRTIWARTVSGSGQAHLCSYFGNTNNLFTITEQWQRFEVNVAIEPGGTAFYAVDFRGSTNLTEIILFGAQLEENSFSTSYIPTLTGTTQTRVVDACSQTPPSGIIGQAEGTLFLYADIQKFNNNNFYIGISNGKVLASAIYMLQPSSGTLQIQNRNSGTDTVLNITTGNWSVGFQKVAIVYTTTSLKVFINGVQKGSISFSGLGIFNRFSIGSRPDQDGGLVPKVDYKDLRVYNTALTDSELISLTSL